MFASVQNSDQNIWLIYYNYWGGNRISLQNMQTSLFLHHQGEFLTTWNTGTGNIWFYQGLIIKFQTIALESWAVKGDFLYRVPGSNRYVFYQFYRLNILFQEIKTINFCFEIGLHHQEILILARFGQWKLLSNELHAYSNLKTVSKM